jgi:hypothetical protein
MQDVDWSSQAFITRSQSNHNSNIMASSTAYLTLPGSGQPIPQVGFGIWKVAPEAAADLVYEVSVPNGSLARDQRAAKTWAMRYVLAT